MMKSREEYESLASVLDRCEADATWPELRPIEVLNDSEPQPFPHEAMGDLVGAASKAIADDVQAPGALAGGSVLAAASLAASPLANVNIDGRRIPLSLYIVSGAASGDRKSATDEVACAAVESLRKEQARQHQTAMRDWEAANAGVKKADRTPQPQHRVLTTGNMTVEGLTRQLKVQSSIGIFSAEGGELLGGHSMRSDSRVSAVAFLCKAWSGESIDSLRSGEGLTVLMGRRVALHVMVQPVLLRDLLADPLADGQGLLARSLIAQPGTKAGSRPYRPVNAKESTAATRFNERIAEMLRQTPRTWENGDGFELKPDDLHLTPDAKAAWVDFYNQIEKAQAPDGDLADARPFASKTAEQAARIAGVLALVEGFDRVELPHVMGGIKLATYYLGEHLRLKGNSRTEVRSGQLLTLHGWMRNQPGMLQTREVTQKAPRAIRDLKTPGIKSLLAELEQRGYIRQVGACWEVRHVRD